MRVYKSKRVPLLHFPALCDIFRKKFFFENFKFFPKKNVLRFLSLRYSADLRRSRLVTIYSSENPRIWRQYKDLALSLWVFQLARWVNDRCNPQTMTFFSFFLKKNFSTRYHGSSSSIKCHVYHHVVGRRHTPVVCNERREPHTSHNPSRPVTKIPINKLLIPATIPVNR